MKYRQDTEEKSIFANATCEIDETPLQWCEKLTVDTVDARAKTLEVIKVCNKLLELLDEVEEK